MIIDCNDDLCHAMQHRILDAATGEDITADGKIFYADDEAGIIRRYRLHPYPDGSEGPMVVFTDDGTEEVDWYEEQRPIRIVPKSAEERAEVVGKYADEPEGG